jgi:hypothetical protein
VPTLDEWRQALAVPRTLTVQSSQALVAAVDRLRLAKNRDRRAKGQVVPLSKRNVAPLPRFEPETEIPIAPIRILHRLGVVTTPPIENLVDVCSWWASLRYAWAFQLPDGGPNPVLRLSTEARAIDFHQKGLLSDHIGVGVAATLLEDLGCPLSIDVSIAADGAHWPFQIEDDEPSPDYLFFNEDRTSIYIVECKGTQTTRSTALQQLRRGLEQLASITFEDQPTPLGWLLPPCSIRRVPRSSCWIPQMTKGTSANGAQTKLSDL